MGLSGSRLKRALDLGGATILLILAAPLLAVAGLLVLVESGWPVFFGHWRVGQAGNRFRCWKLRTMAPDAQRILERDGRLRDAYLANGYKLPNGHDPRVTRIGFWLRRTYIDELPQLVNVLAGDMSLVGPRPVVEEELREYGPHQGELLSVKPGVVGAWACLGPRRPSYPERARLELQYVRGHCFLGDLAILFRSATVVLRGQPDS